MDYQGLFMSNTNDAKTVLVSKLKTTIDIISLFESRIETFQEELDFFITQWEILNKNGDDADFQKQSDYFSLLLFTGLRRLDHEVMFLCIDAYALHESIYKKKSLYEKYIADLGKLILSIDKTPLDSSTYIFPSEWDEEMRKDFINSDSKLEIQGRKKFRDAQGITANPRDNLGKVLDRWKESLVTPESIEKLALYRKEFAHRVDEVDKHEIALSTSSSDAIQEKLDCISTVLGKYKTGLQALLSHLTLE